MGRPDWLTVGGIVNNKREAGYLKHGQLYKLDHHCRTDLHVPERPY